MSIGPWQILLIVIVVLLLFGAGRIPRLMRDMGVGIRAFKKGLNDQDDDKKTDTKTSNSKKDGDDTDPPMKDVTPKS